MQRYDANGTFQDTPFTLSASSGRALFANQSLMADGTAAAPGVAFSSNSNMGMYRAASNVLSMATAGVQRTTLTGTEFQVFVPFRAVLGSDAIAAYGFQSALNTGMSLGGGGALNLAVAGSRVMSMKTDGEITLTIQQWHAGGTAGDLFFDLSQNFVGTDFVVGVYK